MADISFDVAAFRTLFPAFESETTYPDLRLQAFWDMATDYINPSQVLAVCGGLKLARKTYALNLMTAHIAALNTIIASGQTPGQVQSSGIDKISVSLTPPPQANQWQWWLGLTPYGQQLLALLQTASVGGFYVGGLPETAAFRKVLGVF